MHIAQEELTFINGAPAVLQIDIAVPDGFDLRTDQLNARFIGFEYKIIMPCLTVFSDLSDACLFDKKPSFPSVLLL